MGKIITRTLPYFLMKIECKRVAAREGTDKTPMDEERED